MKFMLAILLATVVRTAIPASVAAPPAASSEDVPIGFLPLDSVNATLKKTLSPKGRYVILASTGTVRIFDNRDKINQARELLRQLQAAPALVTVEISVKTGLRRINTQQYPPEQPVEGIEIPVPQFQGPTRVMVNPGGPLTVIPGQPSGFATRRVGPGTVVNPSVTGYATLDPEIRLSHSSLKGGITRTFRGSAPMAKPILLPVLSPVANVPALREWGLAHGVLAAGEPAWTSARTELLVIPEMSAGGLILQVVPQIVVKTGSATAPERRIALSRFSTTAITERGKKGVMDEFPGADVEFYRFFFGAQEAEDDTLAILSAGAGVQYLGQPPKP